MHVQTNIEKPLSNAPVAVHAEYRRLLIQQLELVKISRQWLTYPISVQQAVLAAIDVHRRALCRLTKHSAPSRPRKPIDLVNHEVGGVHLA